VLGGLLTVCFLVYWLFMHFVNACQIIIVVEVSLKMNSILVTGGLGFIGSNLVNELERRYPYAKIYIVDKVSYASNVQNIKSTSRSKLLTCNISQTHLYEQVLQDVDYVFHCAAESHVDKSIQNPEHFFRNNVLATQNLLEVCLHKAPNLKKFVNVSTDEVYGDIDFGDRMPFTTTSPLDPTSPYAASKAAQDMVAMSYYKTFGMPIVTTRCSNNYGPRQDSTKLIPKVIHCLIKGNPIPLYNGGKNERDWLWVYDHVDGLIKAAEAGIPGEVYNFGTSFTTSNLGIITTLGDITKNTPTFDHVEDRKAHDRVYRVDYRKAMIELGWRPSVDLETGLQKTFSWYNNNRWIYD
jgi:dTDP-glucose 4,6-dehydratase